MSTNTTSYMSIFEYTHISFKYYYQKIEGENFIKARFSVYFRYYTRLCHNGKLKKKTFCFKKEK